MLILLDFIYNKLHKKTKSLAFSNIKLSINIKLEAVILTGGFHAVAQEVLFRNLIIITMLFFKTKLQC